VDTAQRRQVNDYRRRAFGGDPDRVIAFVCECGDVSCSRTIQLTAHEYTARRDGILLHQTHETAESGPAAAALSEA
jgi:hypothetical protein